MQNSLFGDDPPANKIKKSDRSVEAVIPDPAQIDLAASLPRHLRLGTSSWNYPGWAGLVWKGEYPETSLSRQGLCAYSKHPLFHTVSLDRSFYQPLNVAQFAQYASQVDENFRFVVKAPSLITDALVRDESGRGIRPNTHFLDAGEALRLFVEPALEGLGGKLGALVFQISPLPTTWLGRMPELITRLHTLLKAIPDLRTGAPDCAIAVEVRDPQWLIPQFTHALRDAGATYCMGLHAKMPSIAEQLPILRALWPGPLVCRWNLNPVHGAYGYEDARNLYAPFNRIVDPDPETRANLVSVIAGTARAGQNVYVTVSNKAEGSAPLSVAELARAICLNNQAVTNG